MRRFSMIYRLFFLAACCCVAGTSWGQSGNQLGNRYQDIVDAISYEVSGDNGNWYDYSYRPLTNINDGDEGTYWYASSSGNITLTFDLGDTHASISSIGLSFANDAFSNNERNGHKPQYITVRVSSNGEDWSTILNRHYCDRTDRSYDIELPNSVDERYMQLELEAQNYSRYLSIAELYLYSVINVDVTHKRAKWFDMRNGMYFVDTFDDITKWYTLGGNIRYQATHTYIDTIYMHRGETVELSIPDRQGTSSSVHSYQRWYSFRSDGSLRTNNTGNNEVWDLLTPTGNSTCYRMDDGYVGNPLGSTTLFMNFYYPTESQFDNWFPNAPVDDNYFVIACDVSSYNDYTEEYTASSSSSNFADNYVEPTLTHRVLFYIMSVDDRTGDAATPTWNGGHGRLTRSEYQSATAQNYTQKKFLEEYDINFPSRRIGRTNEVVVLSKDAQSYAIPGIESDSEVNSLRVQIVGNNSAGIGLAGANDNGILTLSGASRVISFTYPTDSDLGTEVVNSSGSTATIMVTKRLNDGSVYNIARYNLTFSAGSSLLTETMVQQLDSSEVPRGSYWENFAYRTPGYLNEHYQLLTSLNWDYPMNSETHYSGREAFYRYPMDWGYSSYGFYDGSPREDFPEGRLYPEYSYYSIMSGFIEQFTDDEKWDRSSGHLLPGSTYHMYIDASDRPGIIAQLPFEENLCNGTELFVSAWVKSAGYSSTSADAAMLFTIMGVEVDEENKTETYTPIYRHSTGQIRRADFTSLPNNTTDQNDWFQVYFSFINRSEVEYDYYVLQIDNNCSSTSGGDMYLDDVRVYIAQPSANVEQLDYTCSNERTPLNISLDWNRLMERLGAQSGEMRGIDFCFIDETVFRQALTREHLANNADSIQVALNEALRNIGAGASAGFDYPLATLYFDTDFEQNKEYSVDKLIPDAQGNREFNLAINNPIDVNGDGVDERGFYRRGEAATDDREITVDFYANLQPNRPYLMLIMDHPVEQAGQTVTVEDFAAEVLTPCGIQTRFDVTSQTLLKVNGEVTAPEETYCVGQVFNFSAQLRVPTGTYDEEGMEIYTSVNSGVYYDWFFGTADEFTATHAEYGNESLESSLLALRDEYPTVPAINDTVVARGNFKDNHRNLLLSYLRGGHVGGLNSRLVLYRENLDIRILEGGLQLVVQPIATVLSPEELAELGITAEQWANICWGYVPLDLTADGAAPELHAGFNHIQYPVDADGDFNPNLRIGLAQIEEASGENAKTLRVELRGAQYTNDELVDHLGMIEEERQGEPDYSKIYLIASDDPAYFNDLNPGGDPEAFSAYSLPIGDVVGLRAVEYEASETPGVDYDCYANVRFDLSDQSLDNGQRHFRFTPREGYTYTFSVHFEEKQPFGEALVGSCRGTFPVTMKVVPEYMVWNGTATDNWNNDAMWQRVADKTRLNKPATDTYPDGNETTQSFVPMIFSKVIIPRDKKVELYRAGFAGMNGGTWDSDRPTHIGQPTENIQYDLMAYDHPDGEYAGQLRTERYRVNIVDQIHFEPGAEMLHPEYLYYNKAYVDYELDCGRWNTLATPLKEVVAGDFYTKASGAENSEYFKDITFGTDNDRFAPSFYQRAWKNSTTNVTLQNNDGLPANVAVAGNWSALYNDVADAYEAGKGFSLKVQDVPEAAGGKVLVRLPKADASYSYYNMNGGQGGDTTQITRTAENEGKLLVSDMFNRSVEPNYNWGAVEAKAVEVALSESANGEYLLVGNPFMAQLDVQAFLQANSSVLEQKYWTVDDGVMDVAATTGEETTWVSTTGTGSYLVAPLRSFFVKKAEGVTGDVTVTFTQDMQRLSATEEAGTATVGVLRLVASTDDGRRSAAAVAFRGDASNGYASKEDAELFLDSNLGDVPTVYTVGGTQALSINTTPEGGCIPLGVYGTADESVALRFEGVEACPGAELYDTKEQTRTAIYDGMEVEVTTNDAGRYYILTGDGTDDSLADGREGVSVYCVKSGEIVVASVVTSLKAVKVYAADGVLVAEERPDGAKVCRVAVNPDKIYIVHVQDVEGRTVTAKLHVR